MDFLDIVKSGDAAAAAAAIRAGAYLRKAGAR